jgi:hypothetical protein
LVGIGLPPAYGRAIEPEVVGTEAYTNPDYVAAVEIVVGGWLADGQTDKARAALEAVRRSWLAPAEEPSTLMQASVALMDVWLGRAGPTEPDGPATGMGRQAAMLAREAEAPWWVVRAIRTLPDGTATVEELAEAEEIERRLRVAPGATAPPV